MYSRVIIDMFLFLFGEVSELVENFNIRIYSDIVNMINVKLGMMVLLIEVYLLIPLAVTLTMFQGHKNVNVNVHL